MTAPSLLRAQAVPSSGLGANVWAKPLAEMSPNEHELIIDKPISSVFTASPTDHVLRNMGVTELVITGILTDMCVPGTARVGAELGYNAVICADACATMTQRANDEALLMQAQGL